MQEREPALEGESPINAKVARIEHTMSALDKLHESFKGAPSCTEDSVLHIHVVFDASKE